MSEPSESRPALTDVKLSKMFPRFALTICALVALAAMTCARPKGEGYRRVELFSAGKSEIAFMCLVGCHSYDTFVGTTPWKLELDLDTLNECIGGTFCRILRTNPGSDRLWV